ncbi:GGDEF domain-containing protein, partial [Actinoplanes sp. NPDC051633]|uniref:GGDEF domain-containing protein n=1 Tax=Actinoplanes sp. NPDC051633 TaxID=3155670 RepID=UPI00343EE632
HGAGDAVLRETAARLQTCPRESDTVARFGGDEFAVVAERLADPADIHVAAAGIVAAMRGPIHIGRRAVTVTASVGIALNRPGDTADDMLRGRPRHVPSEDQRKEPARAVRILTGPLSTEPKRGQRRGRRVPHTSAVIQPGGNRKPGKSMWIGAVAVVVFVVAGCGLGSKDGGDEPATGADTAKVLTEVDASLKEPFAAVAKGDKAAFDTAAQGLKAGAGKLTGATLTPLADSLSDLSDEVADAGQKGSACPAGQPGADVLRGKAAAKVRAEAKALAAKDASYKFGTFLPAAPKEQTRRLGNGDFVKKKSGSGRGELVIENGAGDTTVSVVPKGQKKPAFVVYVRGKAKHTVEGVKAGSYNIFTAAGEDWDAAKKGFTRDCAFSKFDDDFDFSSRGDRWTITLKEVVGGNASTSDVDPNSFPAG